ncbi:MAG: HlyC/CorC family transporter [Alphaproteobacteria bacterium]|nr:HlyC/CorC family transporter [Alphaproteobacteria bacterium]
MTPEDALVETGPAWEVILTLASILALLMLSAFFSGSETALTAASRARMHRLGQEGDARARRVELLIGDRERLIGALLLGNNLVNILASALATSLLLTLVGEGGVALATILMTLLVLIFSELMPKTYAIRNPDRVAMLVGLPVKVTVTLLAPIVASVRFLVRQMLRIAGLQDDGSDDILSAHEEIRGAIDLHHKEGTVVKDARDMLGGILDLNEIEVADAMIHRKNIVMIDAGQPAQLIVDEVLKSPYSRIPLWKDDPEDIVGVLHVKTLLRALRDVDWDVDRLDIPGLTTVPWFVPETTSLSEQLDAFLARRSHFALVVDEYGALMGLITLEDILEEIVGDISDEHDIAVTGVRPQADGTVNVDGWVSIRDLNRALDWPLPDEEATTVAGLVIHEAQLIPEPGQIFTFHGFKFEILRRQRNQITALRLTPPAHLKRLPKRARAEAVRRVAPSVAQAAAGTAALPAEPRSLSG